MTDQPKISSSIVRNGLLMLITAWLAAVTVLQLPLQGALASLDDLAAIADRSVITGLVSFILAFCFVFILHYVFMIKLLYSLLGVALVYTGLVAYRAEWPQLLGLVALWLLAYYYFWPRRRSRVYPIEPAEAFPTRYTITLVMLAALHVGIMSVIMIYRLRAFRAPTYDDGLFAQMFYQMRIDGSQVTTLERSYPLSHFAVHISPIFYLLLPLYWLFPHPETLQVMQILVAASGVIPLALIMKRHSFPSALRLLFCSLYFFLPAINGSSFFGFHENCFLAPLLLWLFYVLERRHTGGTVLVGILLLAVKEDVIIYFVFIGLWLLFNKRRKAGICLIVLPALVFAIELFFLARFGDGTLAASRFPNVSAFPKLGLLGIVPTFILSPAYFLTQVFVPDKLLYMAQMLLPFAFTPLLQRRDPSRLVLLLPFVIMNLISSYPYLHRIDFQYNYGNAAILLYLSILFWRDHMESRGSLFASRGSLPVHKRRRRSAYVYSTLLLSGLVSAMVITGALWLNRLDTYRYVQTNHETLAKVERILAEIPEEASVRASTSYTTALSHRSKIYDLGYGKSDGADQERTDYYVYDLRYSLKDNVEEEMNSLLASGWIVHEHVEDWILVIRKADLT